MAAAPAAPPDPTTAPGLPSRCLSPAASEEEEAAAAHSPVTPRAAAAAAAARLGVRARGGQTEKRAEPNRAGEEAPLRSRRRRCRCCRRCQVARGGEAVAAAANMFSVRIVTADYYMASPLRGLDICQSPLTQLPVKKVPVVRVFGATPAGKRERAGAGVPSPPGAAAHAAGPLRGRCGLFLSSSLCSPFLPRVTGGKGKKNVGSCERCAPLRGRQAAGAGYGLCGRRAG